MTAPGAQGETTGRKGVAARVGGLLRSRLSTRASEGGLARTALVMFLMRMAARGMAVPIVLLLARGLGPAQYGRYAYGLAWSNILGTVAVFGLDRYLVRTVAEREALGRWGEIRSTLRWSNRTVIASSVVLAGLGAIVATAFVKPDFRTTVYLGLVLVPLVGLTLVRQGTLQGLHFVEAAFVPEQLVFPGIFVIFVAIVDLGHVFRVSAVSVMILNIVAATIAFATGVALLRKRLPRQVRLATAEGDHRGWLRGAAPFALLGLLGVGSQQAGVILLGSLGTASQVGIYQVALRLVDFTTFALVAATASFAPMVSRAHAEGRTSELQPAATRIAQLCVGFCAPIVIVEIALRGPLLHLFGHTFHGGATALTIMALGQLFNAVMGPVGIILLMAGGQRRALYGFSLGLIVNVVLGAILVPRFGATGAAIGQTSGLVVWNLAMWTLTYRRFGIDGSIFSTFRRAR